jgi:hypothetical protein
MHFSFSLNRLIYVYLTYFLIKIYHFCFQLFIEHRTKMKIQILMALRVFKNKKLTEVF